MYDTSAFIDYLKEHPIAIQHFEPIRTGREPVFCSVITETELWAGIRSSNEELEIVVVLSKFNLLPLTSSIARLAGNLLRSKSRPERSAHFGDALIAASAIEVGEPILTADRRSERVFGGQVNYVVYR